MVPKVVLHKKNGHSHAPARAAMSPGELIRLVHSGRQQAVPSSDLLRFAKVVRTERPAAFLEQVARQIDALQSPLAEVLARTQAAFDRGELADVRESLEALRQQADLAARMMTKLVASAEQRAAERVLVDLNDLSERVVGILRGRRGPGVTVATRWAEGLPPVAGNTRQLEQALLAVVSMVWTAAAARERPGVVTVETSHELGVMRGEGVVRLRVRAEGIGLSGEGTDVDLARDIIVEHGGVLSFLGGAAGETGFTVELPTV
jgi:nitrogen-specific signal transduction histidine kinase